MSLSQKFETGLKPLGQGTLLKQQEKDTFLRLNSGVHSWVLLVGVSWRFLNEVWEIMVEIKDIKDEASKRLQENIQKYGILVLQTDLEKKVGTFPNLFRVMDVVFYLLRQAPTKKEKQEAVVV